MRVPADRRLFVSMMGALIVLAWLALWIWEQSPYSRYLNHGRWNEPNLEALVSSVPGLSAVSAFCGSLGLQGDAGAVLGSALLYVGGWTLMTVAMMLPTTLPLIVIFRRLTAGRRERGQLVALLIAGYLAAWLGFGIVAHVADWGLYAALGRNPWLLANGWAVGTGTLLLAGGFQFTRLKYRCLDKCRTPLSFVTEHWTGQRERWNAFRLGAHHGIFCVGCCWALMLLMFGVGIGNVGWMLALGAVMAVEKNLPWGRVLAAPLGIGLIGWGLSIPLYELWLAPAMA